jgi:hypothetical protein
VKSVDKVTCFIRHLADFGQIDVCELIRAREPRRTIGGDESLRLAPYNALNGILIEFQVSYYQNKNGDYHLKVIAAFIVEVKDF